MLFGLHTDHGAYSQGTLCFGSEASLQFHKASASRNDPTPHLQATQWMIARYPQDIQNWIAAKGGITKMPNGNNFWTLDANELWAMGYRKCAGGATSRAMNSCL